MFKMTKNSFLFEHYAVIGAYRVCNARNFGRTDFMVLRALLFPSHATFRGRLMFCFFRFGRFAFHFTPWKSEFEIDASKKVTVEIKSQQKPLIESKGPKVQVSMIKETKKINKSKQVTITESEKDHIFNIMKLLIHEDVNINNLSYKKDKLNKVIAVYNQFKPINKTSKGTVMNGVLTVLAKQK